MRQISAAQERGAEAYCCTPHKPSDEHAWAAGQAAAGQARWRAIRAPLASATMLVEREIDVILASSHRRQLEAAAAEGIATFDPVLTA